MLENRVKCERKSNGIVNSKKNDQNINSIPSLEKYRYFLKKIMIEFMFVTAVDCYIKLEVTEILIQIRMQIGRLSL